MSARHYGPQPPKVVVVHGGPGAAGEVAPIAQDLARRGYGVLEPFQTKKSVSGQIGELGKVIRDCCPAPVTLIGWSWGAWLSALLTADAPELVASLILVGSGPFEARDAEQIKPTRLSRLSDAERAEYLALRPAFDDPRKTTRLMELFDKMDGYQIDATPHPTVQIDMTIHAPVWKEAAALRASGELLRRLATLRTPVLALHGDHDPHPAEGVRRPLQEHVPGAGFVFLEKCGHKPWREIHAKERFYAMLETAIKTAWLARPQ